MTYAALFERWVMTSRGGDTFGEWVALECDRLRDRDALRAHEWRRLSATCASRDGPITVHVATNAIQCAIITAGVIECRNNIVFAGRRRS